jgi:NTP pyrophosphatase (non-canonical NTP hydrolase)
MDIDLLMHRAFTNSSNHGFWDDYDFTLGLLEGSGASTEKYTVDIKLSKIALVGSELGECIEGVRKPRQDEHCPLFTSEEVELADAIIRICDYAERFQLRLSESIQAKMNYNTDRPYKHGKSA